jgi:hypothetical protein
MPPRRRTRPGAPLRAVGPEARRSPSPRPALGASGARGAGGARGALAGEPVRVLVDGRNVQHALAREIGSSLPTAALVAMLRAAFSPATKVELILDGHPSRGPQGRVAPGLTVVFSKGVTADDVIGSRVSEAFRDLGPVDAWSIVVVTDDHQVRDHARRNGIRVEGTVWVAERLRAARGRGTAGTGVGNARPPRVPPAARPDGSGARAAGAGANGDEPGSRPDAPHGSKG